MSDVASDDLGNSYPSTNFPVEPCERFLAVLTLAGTRTATATDLPQVIACLGADPVDLLRRLEMRRWHRKIAAERPDNSTRRALIRELRRRERLRREEGCETCGQTGDPADNPCKTSDGRKAHQTHARRAS